MLNIVNILCIILVVRCTLTVSDELFDANAVARNLNKSIEESDYETVIDIIVKHNPRERYLISEAYNVSVGIHPINKFNSVLTGNFKDLVLGLMKPLPDYLIDELHVSLNTDNEAIIEILCTLNPYELDLIKKHYNGTFGNDLVSDLENSTSGDFKELVVSIARGNRDSIAKRVNLTLVAADAQDLVDASGENGLGTRASRFISIFTARNEPYLVKTFDKYKNITGKDIEVTIEDIFSGDMKMGLLAIVKCATSTFKFSIDKLYESLQHVETKARTLTRIMVLPLSNEIGDKQLDIKNRYNVTLESLITGKTSGLYRKGLLALLAPAEKVGIVLDYD